MIYLKSALGEECVLMLTNRHYQCGLQYKITSRTRQTNHEELEGSFFCLVHKEELDLPISEVVGEPISRRIAIDNTLRTQREKEYCGRCRKTMDIDAFAIRDGERLKTCITCLDTMKESKRKLKSGYSKYSNV